MADSRNILTRLLESEATLPYVLGTAGALAGGSLLYCYLLRKLRLDAIQRVDYSPVSDNVVVEENVVSTATAEAKDNTLMGGNLTNRAMGFQAKTSAIGNKVTDGDLLNNPIHSSGSQASEMSQVVPQQTAPKVSVLSISQGDGGEEKRDNPLSSSSDLHPESDIGKALSSSSVSSQGNAVTNGNMYNFSIVGDVHAPLVSHASPLLEEKEPLPKFFQPDIPFFVESRFVKRNTLLSQIESTFLADQNAPQQRCAMTALTACHGLGGVGKTQLALYYYHKSEKLYPLRCWFSAERLDASYREFCKKFQLKVDEKASFEEISRKVKEWLEEHSDWLLVYDNAADCNSIASHLPTTGGDILVTSRHTLEWSQIGGQEVSVDIVSEEEAIELVKRTISFNGEVMPLGEQEEVSLKKLVSDELGRLPLALAQAAAYIKSCPSMTITSYLDKYKNIPEIYLDKALNQRTYPTSVAKTWLITMEEIEKRLPAALPVFKACAYLAPDAIPIQLLSQLILVLDSPGVEEKEGENEEDKLKDNPLLDEILICLAGFSMIGYNKETHHVSIHRLVQTAIRQKDDKELSSIEERFEKRLRPVSDALLKINLVTSKGHNSLEYYLMARVLQPHFEGLIAFLEPFVSEKLILELLCTLYDVSAYVSETVMGNAKKAIHYYQRVLQIEEMLYGKDSIQISSTLSSLGGTYNSFGDYENARCVLERALKIQEAYYEKDSVEIAKTLSNLGGAYESLGDHVKAHNYLERALKVHETRDVVDQVEISKILSNLGAVYGSLGDHVKQCDYLERALGIQEAYYGKDHIDTLIILHNLSTAYDSLGNYVKKRDLSERALKIAEAYYGKNHVQVAAVFNSLGGAYESLGDHTKAHDYLERALKIQEAYYGENHVAITGTLANLGAVYGSSGDYIKQHDYLERALRIQEAHYGKGHIETAVVLYNLGFVYGSLGDHAKKSDVLERVLKVQEAYYGKDHIKISKTLYALCAAYLSLGDYEKGLNFLEQVLTVEEAHYGKDHEKVSETLSNLGAVYGSLCNYVKQCDYLERALKIKQMYSGEDDIELFETLSTLSAAYRLLGNYTKQCDYLKRVLSIQEARYGKDHVEIAKTLDNLGAAYGSLNDHATKRDVLERALNIKQASHGEDHVEVAITLTDLGAAYASLGDYNKACDLLNRALKIKEIHYKQDDNEVAITLHNLGNVYGLLGDYSKQCDFLERALRIMEAHYGKDHVKVAVALNNLGHTYCSLGNSVKQRNCLERALNIFMNTPGYGEQHPHAQIVIRQLSSMSSSVQLEKTNEAEAVMQSEEKKQKQAGSFFDKEKGLLENVIKKYKLPDGSQGSLERGLRNAAANGNLKDLEIFARYVKNLNAQDENPQSRKTAAHWAAIKSHEDCYNFLVVEKKACTGIPDASNKTADEYRGSTKKAIVAQA